MNNRSISSSLVTIKSCFWTAILLLIALHLLPYVSTYTVPNYDYFTVMSVINHLNAPDLFPPEGMSALKASIHTRTAPLFYYFLALPLSFIVSSKWVLLSLGILVTMGSAYFAGLGSDRVRDWMIAGLVVYLLLHIFQTPLEGNRRSFLSFFLLAALWLKDSPSYYWALGLTALAAGVYPPGALLLLTYFSLWELYEVLFDDGELPRATVKVAGLLAVFLLVLTPFWWDLLVHPDQSKVTKWVPPLSYRLGSVPDLLGSFLVSECDQCRGALFRFKAMSDPFFAFLSLFVVQWYLLGDRLLFRKPYRLLIVAGLLVWLVAHVTHPLIYQPFKYSRLSLLLAVALPVLENFPRMVQLIREEVSREGFLRFTLYVLAVINGLFWIGFVTGTVPMEPLENTVVVGNTWWKFLFSVPVGLVPIIAVPKLIQRPVLRSFLSGILILSMMSLPHTGFSYQWESKYEKTDFSVFAGVNSVIRETPPGTVIAGPPHYMDLLQVFGKREAFTSNNFQRVKVGCDRSKQLWGVYFSGDSQSILQFLKSNDIDYLLVDRKVLSRGYLVTSPTCVGEIEFSHSPFLNRRFSEAAWSKGDRFYLVKTSTLESVILKESF